MTDQEKLIEQLKNVMDNSELKLYEVKTPMVKLRAELTKLKESFEKIIAEHRSGGYATLQTYKGELKGILRVIEIVDDMKKEDQDFYYKVYGDAYDEGLYDGHMK